jgi:hypothetical protein
VGAGLSPVVFGLDLTQAAVTGTLPTLAPGPDGKSAPTNRSGVTGTPRAHKHKDRGNDLYETPPEAVAALLQVENIPKTVWECACGPGSIVGELRAHGHNVIATDLIDYGLPGAMSGQDFLVARNMPDGAECIVTNPPFKYANEFVAKARVLAPMTVMLLRLGFFESVKRTGILESGDLARVHIFRERLPRMHRAGWTGKKAGSQIAFAWFVWVRGHQGPTIVDRISWKSAGSKSMPERDLMRSRRGSRAVGKSARGVDSTSGRLI